MTRAAIAIVLGAATTVSADSKSAKAEALFRQGRELMTQNKFEQACAAFDASQKLEPATTTLFNQADCREKAGQLATAWGLFIDAERQTRSATDDVGAKLHKVAQDRATALEARLSKLTITVATPVDGLVVLRDNDPIDAGELGRAMPVDGGTHSLVARVGTREVWSETVTVGNEKDAASVTVTVQAAKLHDQSPTTTTPTTTTPVDTPPRSHTSAYVASGAALVLLGGALGFNLWGNSLYNDAVMFRDEDEWSAANTRRYIAEGLLVGGVACAGLATYLWLHHGGSSDTVVAPVGTASGAGLVFAHRF